MLPRWPILLLAATACGASEMPTAPDAATTLVNASDVPIDGLPADDVARFDPIRQLAGIAAPVYSDLLLHDMGAALADGLTGGSATSPAWRTAPLIGLRFSASYLHDGRAATITDAVLAHDGEAAASRSAFQALSPDDQRSLIDFVSAL